MHTWLALLRAVNVTGHNKLPMPALRALLEGLGYERVRTYIQSGNAVFQGRGDAAGIASEISEAIASGLGLDVTVIVRSRDEVDAVVAAMPFPTEGVDPRSLHVVFLDGAPAGEAVARLDPNRSPPDAFAVVGREVYLSLPNGSARSKLNLDYFESRLGVRGTGRNWRTVKLLQEWLAG